MPLAWRLVAGSRATPSVLINALFDVSARGCVFFRLSPFRTWLLPSVYEATVAEVGITPAGASGKRGPLQKRAFERVPRKLERGAERLGKAARSGLELDEVPPKRPCPLDGDASQLLR